MQSKGGLQDLRIVEPPIDIEDVESAEGVQLPEWAILRLDQPKRESGLGGNKCIRAISVQRVQDLGVVVPPVDVEDVERAEGVQLLEFRERLVRVPQHLRGARPVHLIITMISGFGPVGCL